MSDHETMVEANHERPIPEPHFDPLEGDDTPETSSLIDDVSALFEDGKTYAQAELAFQKSRARFVGDRTKGVVVFAVGAIAAFHLALIAVTVGLVFALATLIGPWLATLAVTLAYLIVAAILGLKLKSRIGEIRSALKDQPHA